MMIQTQSTQKTSEIQTSDRVSSTKAYTEVTLNEHSAYEKDVLSQFRANLNQLEDLHGRVKFLMKEVSTSIHKKA